ncbi:hypothetical protein [Cerasicoccus maritimus]|uniref:hypothetical protein n=1 Tax=Cerasicoccus maritimus TaxID=490089 RepID=UPI002852A856|nr:hypothetical protein [Cerasicoccus maritimus]
MVILRILLALAAAIGGAMLMAGLLTFHAQQTERDLAANKSGSLFDVVLAWTGLAAAIAAFHRWKLDPEARQSFLIGAALLLVSTGALWATF